jgi:phosphoglycerol transferase MdoB-like AlkP superfamily enzyme
MNLLLQEVPVSELAPQMIQETPLPDKDPLIARGLQKEQYFAIFGLAIIVIAAVGFFSRRLEYALILAFVLSAILIAVLLLI